VLILVDGRIVQDFEPSSARDVLKAAEARTRA
jgi:hypothetical protein